ncbi:hypothetical protein QQF64_019641 [Cirrhinus molitorella]|uniref:Integrase catalytic domain-containing protein n=1 Tax=Cirrhinus molitorella TaxID=172907 RepID=A0ABR3LHL5_9TELE
MSLRRFIARRGKPFELLSDNGTNFVGGDKEMRAAYDAMIPQLRDQLTEQQISFRFIPPGAPHFGGAWEREVKSVKQALKVVLKDQTVTETVLCTVLIEVEGILNAKPLGYVSSDVSDLDPVTPSILLMGRHDSSLPQVLYDSSNLLGTRRWKHSQVLADHFWSSFIHYYLPNLQERQKWRKDGGEIGLDQVVLIVDPELPQACWPVGKVSNTFPGLDGRTRTVEVQVIVMYLQVLECEKNTRLVQMAWNYMNDSLRTDVFLRFRAETVACACIFLSARVLQIPLPEQPAWFLLFGVSEQDLIEISCCILRLYSMRCESCGVSHVCHVVHWSSYVSLSAGSV